jgi:hypothetical protein
MYRYQLTRQWAESKNSSRLTVVMLNPSVADITHDDPTIRRCIGFAKAAGAGGLLVVNLFALRSTDPDALAKSDDPVGPVNDAYILAAARASDRTVAAWGAHPFASLRAGVVCEMLLKADVLLECWGKTRDGHPRHPLYVQSSARLQPWEPP